MSSGGEIRSDLHLMGPVPGDRPPGPSLSDMTSIQQSPAPTSAVTAADEVAAVVARARAAQEAIADWDQQRVDDLVTAVGWAIVGGDHPRPWPVSPWTKADSAPTRTR